MAYLVTNNTFNPYSFDEMVKPLNMYKQAYDQSMNQYDSLGQLAGEWEKLGKEDPQSQAYKDYQAYSQSLNQAANDLATQGLNPEVRNRIRGLNQSFKQTINPIAEAWQRREVARAAQKDALLKNPDLFFQRDLSNPEQGGIDNFIKDTGYGYGQTVNGATIRANVQNRMAALAKELRGIGQNGDKSYASVKAGQNVSGDLQRVLPYQYRILQEHGFRSEDIQKYLNGEPMDGAIKEVLDGVVNSELASSGIQSGNFTDDQVNRATDIARSGLWAGVGQSDWRYLNDGYGQAVALENIKHNNAMSEINARNNKSGKGSGSGNSATSDTLHHPVDFKNVDKNKAGLDLRQYITKDANGKYIWKPSAVKQLTKEANKYSVDGIMNPWTGELADQPFKEGIGDYDYQADSGTFKNRKTGQTYSPEDVAEIIYNNDNAVLDRKNLVAVPIDANVHEKLINSFKNTADLREIEGVDYQGNFKYGKGHFDVGDLYKNSTFKGGDTDIYFDRDKQIPVIAYDGKYYYLPLQAVYSELGSDIDSYRDVYEAIRSQYSEGTMEYANALDQNDAEFSTRIGNTLSRIYKQKTQTQ